MFAKYNTDGKRGGDRICDRNSDSDDGLESDVIMKVKINDVKQWCSL